MQSLHTWYDNFQEALAFKLSKANSRSTDSFGPIEYTEVGVFDDSYKGKASIVFFNI